MLSAERDEAQNAIKGVNDRADAKEKQLKQEIGFLDRKSKQLVRLFFLCVLFLFIVTVVVVAAAVYNVFFNRL